MLTILQGDALHLPLADGTVDLVVTSPPYFGLRSYQDGGKHYDGQIGAEATSTEFVDALLAATREMVRVLKPSGSIWVNLGDKYAGQSAQRTATGLSASEEMAQGARDGNRRSRPAKVEGIPGKSLMGVPWRYAIRCIDELGLILRAEVIWSKPNGLPESVTDRVRRSHETWFHFTKEPRYFSAVDELRQPHKSEPGREGIGALGGQKTLRPVGPGSGAYNPLGALPGSVWTIATEPLRVPESLGIDHFAAFPTEWPRRIITGWSPVGGVVLDPFGGTGTTALVADVLGRDGISVDMSADYCRLAQWRTTDPGQRARAARVEAVEAVPEAQLSLFGGVA